jgi:hypothetical protein
MESRTILNKIKTTEYHKLETNVVSNLSEFRLHKLDSLARNGRQQGTRREGRRQDFRNEKQLQWRKQTRSKEAFEKESNCYDHK